MSDRRAGWAGAPRLIGATLLLAAVLGTSVAMGTQDPRVSPPPPEPTAGAAALSTARLAGERQHATLADEDERLLRLVGSVRPGSGPYLQQVDGADTLVLTAAGIAYGLADLVRLGAAEIQPDGVVLLTRSVFVAPAARLVVDAPGSTMRLLSDGSGFVSLVAWKADLVLSGSSGRPLGVTSWDPTQERPDEDVVDGRAYIRQVSGEMRVRHANVSHLGFWAGRTSGLAWTGSSRAEATGSIVDSTFRANHYGVFASQAEALSISGATFAANAVDGLALHRRTADTTITSSSAHGNGRHGFSADQGSESLTFAGVRASGNTSHGIFFSGKALSDGQSAGGASLRTYGEVTLAGGLLRDNGGAGLRVVEGRGISVRGTRVIDNRDGIVLAGTAAPAEVEDAVITGRHRLGISVTGGVAAVSGNRVSGSATGIRVRDAAVSVTGNAVAQATDHAVSVIGTAAGSAVVDNDLAGRGPSGLDLFRLSPELAVEASGNDLEGWTQDRDNWEYWSAFIPNHPMLLLWVVVLGLPASLAVRARRSRIPVGTPPYQDALRPARSASPRGHAGRPMTSGRPA